MSHLGRSDAEQFVTERSSFLVTCPGGDTLVPALWTVLPATLLRSNQSTTLYLYYALPPTGGVFYGCTRKLLTGIPFGA